MSIVAKPVYSIDQSPLFKLGNQRRLAKHLRISQKKLVELCDCVDLYREFVDVSEKTDKERDICAPREDLKIVQRRIDNLLRRIAPPDFLFCPVKGRSYVDNAARHRSSRSVKLLDIKSFYPNCKSSKVFWFFNSVLRCTTDVAGVLVKLTCFKGCLPTGSPCSPVLGYLAYIDMWAEIESAVTTSDCLLSVYVDDITISGEKIPGDMVWSVKRTLRRHGHLSNSKKEASRHLKSAEITGVIVNDGNLLPPNRQRHKLTLVREERRSIDDLSTDAIKLDLQISGRQTQVKQILGRNKGPHNL